MISVPRLIGYAILILSVGSVTIGAVLGQPVLLSYVETDSMSPTMEPGDGFVAVPTAVDGSVDEGDVITFRAEELHGGGLTTHRVVGETDRGYVTQGDANPFTDQDGGEPPVRDAQIVATALQVNGEVLVIPHLGTAVTAVGDAVSAVQRTAAATLGTRSLLGTNGLAYLFFGATLLLYAHGWYAGGDRGTDRSRERETGLDARLVAAGFALLLVAGATAAMVGPAGTQEYGVVSAEFESERPTVIPAGGSNNVPYALGNPGVLPAVAYVEPASDGVDVAQRRVVLGPRSGAETTVTLHAPDRTGYYRRYVVEHRYLALLPVGAIDALYELHPWAPIVAIDALLGVPFYLLGVALLGTGRVRDRSRDGPTLVGRLGRRFR
jgi:signal peptidase